MGDFEDMENELIDHRTRLNELVNEAVDTMIELGVAGIEKDTEEFYIKIIVKHPEAKQ